MTRKPSAVPLLAVGCLGLIATGIFALSNAPDSSASTEAKPTQPHLASQPANTIARPAPAVAAAPAPAAPPKKTGPGPKQLAACQSALDQAVTSDTLAFPEEEAVLTKKSQKTLAKAAAIVRDICSGAAMEIQGHTDGTGPRDKNLALSQNRAEAVKNYLVAQGLAPDTLTAIGFGPDKPAATNKTPAGRAKNRRIELRVVPGE